MLSVAANSLSSLPSTIRDSFSRNNSDNEQSKEISGEENKSDSSNDSNGNSPPSSLKVSSVAPPFVEGSQQNLNVDGSLKAWQAGPKPPTTNIDTTTITATSSGSPTSLKIENFDFKDDQIETPTVEDYSPQIPIVNNTSDNTTYKPTQSSQQSKENIPGRRPFKLPTPRNSGKTKLKKKRSESSVADEIPFIDSPGLSGLSPASPKKNAEFHTLFRSVPEDDYLINDYGCALQKEILVQGRLYVSTNYVCFNANIFGWVTNLVIAFSDIVSIEKRMTAFVIPNAILVSTLHAKHFFASFMARDNSYELLQTLWRRTHPTLSIPTEPEFNKNNNENSDTSVETSAESNGEGKSTSGRHKKIGLHNLKSDTKKLGKGSTSSDEKDIREKNIKEKDIREKDQKKLDQLELKIHLSPKKSEFYDHLKPKSQKGHRPRSKSVETEIQSPILDIAPISDFPTSESNSTSNHSISSRTQPRKTNIKKRRYPTHCACLKHYDNVSLDTTFKGTVEQLYNLIFVSDFCENYVTNNEKCLDVKFGEWNIVDGKLIRNSSYIKPLNNSIGPRSTKCCIMDETLHKDFDNYVVNLSTTTTPDVPSGNSFSVKTRTCFMWAGPNETRIITTCAVEWSKSSWLKGPIEKACIEGQSSYWKNLSLASKKHIATHPSKFQGESGSSPVRGEIDLLDEKVPLMKERTRSAALPLDTTTLDQDEPTIEKQNANIWNAVFEIPNVLFSILTPMMQNISIPSTNTIIILAMLFMMISNFYNWLLLRDIGQRLDNAAIGDLPSYGGRNEFLHYDDLIESEGEVLWKWLAEKSRKDAGGDVNHSEDELSSPKCQVDGSLSSFNCGGGSDGSSKTRESEPIPVQRLHEQIGDLHKLLQAAEGHVKKLVDVTEFESAYYPDREKKQKKHST
ncbi:hypothetical protein Glove_46g177 [Diversispora epigaea]|uniref:VASt domain-containing protein n=1 Tax=Diversispora epigaea TaxID=1348612 RepID=A0A397JLE3_9GLOM|nr:hypothetical protein Glove_46g177 [Diversispora epigaea]